MEWSTHANCPGHRTLTLQGQVVMVRREPGHELEANTIPRPWPSGLYFKTDQGREQRFLPLADAAPPSCAQLLTLPEIAVESFWDRAEQGWPTRAM
ncbi:MAG: hypothetical protein V4558_02335 [Gemmatimonadota bacterium]